MSITALDFVLWGLLICFDTFNIMGHHIVAAHWLVIQNNVEKYKPI